MQKKNKLTLTQYVKRDYLISGIIWIVVGIIELIGIESIFLDLVCILLLCVNLYFSLNCISRKIEEDDELSIHISGMSAYYTFLSGVMTLLFLNIVTIFFDFTVQLRPACKMFLGYIYLIYSIIYLILSREDEDYVED